MKRKEPVKLGDLQLKILKFLWVHGEATVTDVHEHLSKEKVYAYTTIATMLKKMEGRKLVQHQSEGRTFVYTPAVGEEQVTRNMVNDVLDRVFKGSLPSMIHHLLSSREIGSDELKELETLIKQQKGKK